jgi:transcriptional regulator of heat shock response
MINERQAYILSAVIREYVETAMPVASKVIAEKYDLPVSPATIRNDMAYLEEIGLLRQPHTSSGRIPTEDGYRLYLKMMSPKPKMPAKIQMPLKHALEIEDTKEQVREIAKAIVKLSGETAFASIDDGWRYYTGFSELFQKPDFQDMESLRQLSKVFDRFDEVMKDMFEQVDSDVSIFIGRENPVSEQMATILVKYNLPRGISGVIGLTGPLRMDYGKNIGLLSQVKKLMEE